MLVLTGAGDAFRGGMDLKAYCREVDGTPAHVQRRVRRDDGDWQIRMLRSYAKPTIATRPGRAPTRAQATARWRGGGSWPPAARGQAPPGASAARRAGRAASASR